MVRVLINVPKTVRRDEPFEVLLLISHPMESGQRRDTLGLAIPREIIDRLDCTLDGEAVIHMSLFPAISANPYLSFSAVAQRSGTMTITFSGDRGLTQVESVPITVV